MKLTDISSHITGWFDGSGPLSDIVISSRVRLARNLEGFNFLSRCDETGKLEILAKIKDVILSLDSLTERFYIDISKSEAIEKSFLVERHLISRGLASNKGPRGVVVADNELFGAMINEEDHLRLQVLKSGLNLRSCWEKINAIDDLIEAKLRYAFDANYGYLTACPTNVGTGIRVSVMLHLPGLKITEQLNKFFNATREMNLAVRGLFGEGTEAVGDFYQISNQITLGISETDIIEKFTDLIIPEIVEYEKLARDEMLLKEPNVFDDKISRALAVLKSAKLISSHEALFLLSNLRMGINMGRIDNISIKTVNELFLLTQPAHLQLNHGRKLDAEQRDTLRAETLRAHLN